MLLAVDIGNSNVKFGIFDGATLKSKFSIPTIRNATFKSLSLAIDGRLKQMTEAIVCSVVPDLDAALEEFLKKSDIKPVFVHNDVDFGITIQHRPLESIGTDRLVNAFAATEKYGAPCAVCSFGTATTIDLVDETRTLVGGLIAPGMRMMAKSLHTETAKLPAVEIGSTEILLATTTDEAIRSGILYSAAGLVESVVSKIHLTARVKIIATGGFAPIVAAHSKTIDVVDENLLLDGLRLLHGRT